MHFLDEKSPTDSLGSNLTSTMNMPLFNELLINFSIFLAVDRVALFQSKQRDVIFRVIDEPRRQSNRIIGFVFKLCYQV